VFKVQVPVLMQQKTSHEGIPWLVVFPQAAAGSPLRDCPNAKQGLVQEHAAIGNQKATGHEHPWPLFQEQ
jgi:hypothetical protein